MLYRNAFIGALLVFALPLLAADPNAVRVWEEKTVIPTYLAGDPEPNPIFNLGRQSQGAQDIVYPYPLYDNLTHKKVDKTYTIVYLENEWVRLGILPEIGGRLFEGVDKTNNYNFIYRQHVIKPALIGLIGAWMSGGIEWNIPHHHRASTFLPVQYRVESNDDGSKTVWVGELEVRHRMRWAVGYTLRPGKAYMEARVRIVNRTPAAETMLCFANVAVHVNDDYQVIFPPSTQWGTFHAKDQFIKWPIADSVYSGADFTKGVDVSWYKNHKLANSIFAWNYRDDFFAGYDHGKQAGTMSVADHNIVPGKKVWTWGNGPRGRMWDHILTDTDGPYDELMVGAYSDNQPDYSWLQPFDVKSFSMNWYPFRDIGGAKEANLDAAVNLDVEGATAKVGFYTTSAHPAAVVQLTAGSQVLVRETVAISPAKPWTKAVAVPAGTDPHDLRASISVGGRELVSYSPLRLTPEPMPKPVTRPLPPAEVGSNEERYLIGLRAEQFHDPSINPEDYWLEVLRRDPKDARVNTALGIRRYRQGRFAESETYLRQALERPTDRFTTPKDAEPIYYLGLAQKAQGKDDEAFANLYKATWNLPWRAAGYYEAAEIATRRGDTAAALDYVERSLDNNALNIRALNLKAALLRRLGRKPEALQVLAKAHRASDPLDVRSMAERWLASGAPEARKELVAGLNAFPATATETAAEYMNAGLWQDGTAVLLESIAAAPDKNRIQPLVYYYLGYFAGRMKQPEKAAEYYALAAKMPPDYVFPFQNEVALVLRDAIQANPRDARAPYYLGNLLFDWQPEEARALWEKSAELDPSFAIVHRNLALAWRYRKSGSSPENAIAELEKAVAQERKYALHFTELDELYQAAGVDPEKRLAVFEKNQDVVAQRDDSLAREIELLIALGKYDQAIRMLGSKEFSVWEGGTLKVAENWIDAHLFRGRQRLASGQYKEALADFRVALEIPSNLPSEEMMEGHRASEANYWMGRAQQAAGDQPAARESWKKSLAAVAPPAPHRRRAPLALSPEVLQTYYQALAMHELGEPEKAGAMFQELLDTAGQALKSEKLDRAQLALAHYVSGLGHLGLKDSGKAKAEFSQALQASPDHAESRFSLAQLR